MKCTMMLLTMLCGGTPLVAQGTYSLIVFTVRDSDGSRLPDAQVCVGTSSSPALYARVKSAGSYGRAVFTNLAAAKSYVITTSKGGYAGLSSTFPATGTSGSITIRPKSGSGGPVCPGAAIQFDGTSSTALSPGPLGLEALDTHGDWTLGSPEQRTLDCRDKGAKMVMVGIDGNHGEGIDRIRVLCAPVGANATLADAPTPTSLWGDANGANPFERKCDNDMAVVGISGTVDGILRSVRIRCQAITAAGLTSGPIYTKDPAGKWVGIPWYEDDCSDGRPARSLKVSRNYYMWPRLLSVMVISGVQMRCEQPQL